MIVLKMAGVMTNNKSNMKKINLLIVLLLSISISNSQVFKSGEITYSVSFPYVEHNEETSSVNDLTKKIFEQIDNIELMLIFNTNEALFSVINKTTNDSEIDYFVRSAKKIVCKGTYYTNIKEDIKIISKKFIGDRFLVQLEPNKIKWNITNDTKKIQNHICIKATAIIEKDDINTKDRLITAWFTKDINLPFGPKTFSGLPGIILELKENNINYIATSLKINKDETIKINKPNKGLKISEKQFNEYVIQKAKDYGFQKNEKK